MHLFVDVSDSLLHDVKVLQPFGSATKLSSH